MERLRRRVDELERELAAARKTIDVLIRRVDQTSVKERSAHALFQTMAQLERAVEERTRSLERSQAEIRRYSGHLEELVAQRTAALRESMERYQSLFDNAAEAIFTLDREGRVTDVNPEALRVSGYRREDIVGVRAVEFVAEEDREQLLRATARLREEEGTIQSFPARVAAADGRVLHAEFNVALARDRHGEYVGYQISARDVSARVELQQALQQAQKMEILGSLAAGIAHDFNNVLAAILPAADRLVQDIPEDHPLHLYVTTIRRAGEHAAGLTAQLLAFTRHGPADVRVFDPGRAVHKVLDLVDALFARRVTVTRSVVSSPGVRMDRTQFEQILLNLLVNAREATGDGGHIAVSCGPVELDGTEGIGPTTLRGRHLRLTVQDDGPGIDPQIAGRVFEPFFTTKPAGKSTGLGLAVVATVVEQAGGGVRLTSEPGQGARFEIYLPLTTGEDVDTTSEQPLLRFDGRILVVEDDDVLRALVIELLQELGYDVVQAPDGLQALDRMRPQRPFDAVLLDMRVPYLGGRDLLRAIRERQPGVPAVLTSGFVDAAERDELLTFPDTVFVQKPYRLPTLAAAIARVSKKPAAPADQGSGQGSSPRSSA